MGQQNYYQNQLPPQNHYEYQQQQSNGENIALMLRGLPFQIKPADLQMFFQNYAYVQGSIFLGKNNEGRRTGYGAILFQNEAECLRAMNEKQG